MSTPDVPADARRATASPRRRWASLTAGGTDGNEQLTALTGLTLIALLAVVGVTILRIRQLIWLHLFVGLLLLGPVGLKLASTGYRFVRYYAGNLIYRLKGPPRPLLRAIAPALVVSTIVVLLSGVLLLFHGPGRRDGLLLLHKASFIVWLAVTALHVLAHLPGLSSSLRGAGRLDDARGLPGTSGRWLALAGALVGGLVLAIVLVPDFSAWTAPGAFPHHHFEH